VVDEPVAERTVLGGLDGARQGRRRGVRLAGLLQQVGMRSVQRPLSVKLARRKNRLEHRQSSDRPVCEPDSDSAVDLDNR
jgi:hypothetical protein